MKTVLVVEGGGHAPEELQDLLRAHGYTATLENSPSLQVSEVPQSVPPRNWQPDEKGGGAGFRFTLDGKSYQVEQAENATLEVAAPLQGTEQHYRKIYENAPVGIFRSSLGGKLLAVNPACARMLKYASPQELIAAVNRTGIAEAVYAHHGRREEVLHRVLQSRDWQICEERFLCKDGSIIDTLSHLRAVRDAEGSPFELEGFVEDITERKSAERVLEFTQFAINNAADQVFWVDEQGRFVYVNDAACYSLGCSHIELTGMSIFDIDPDCSPEVFSQRWQEIKRHCSATFERRHQTRDGHIFPVEIRANYLVYEGREYLCLFAADISERKRAERALKFTQFAIDKSKDMAFWVTDDGHFFYVNDATCRTLGYSREELLQMSILDIDPTFQAEELVEFWRELKEKGSLTLEALHRAKDGRTYPVEVRANYLEVDGKGYNCAFVVDISERKEQEQLQRLTQFAIDNTVDQAFWLTPEGRIIYVNEAVCAALGYSREELIGMSIPDIDPDFGFEMLAEGWETLKAKGSISFESRHKAKDGRVYPVEIRSNYVSFEGKEFSCSFATDISERRRNEEKLRSANDLLRAIIEAAPTAIVGLDLGGKVCHVWNPAAEKMLGWGADEVMGGLLPSVLQESEGEFRRFLDWAKSGQALDGIEVRRQRKDGTPIDCRIFASPLKDADGGIIGNIAVLLDITEQKRAEWALQLTQFAIDHTVDQAFWMTEDSRLIYVNDAACRSLGYSREELLQMSVPDIDPVFQPGVFAEHRRQLKEKGSVTFESWHRAKDGRIYPVEIRANYVVFDGKEYNCAFATDISERKEKEQALRLTQFAIDNTADQAFWRTQDGRITYVNESACAALGYTRDELIGMAIPDIDPDFSLERLSAAWETLKAEGSLHFESRHRAKDGRIYPVEIRTNYVNCDGNEFSCSFVTDISERKATEQALRQASLIVENSPAVLFRWRNAEGWPVEMVTGNVTQFGYSQEELLSGSVPFVDLVHPEDLDRVAAEVQEYIDSGEDRFGQEYRIVTKQEEVRWIDDRTVAERDAEGRVTHLQGVVMDISDRKRTENVIAARMRLLQFAASHTLEELLEATLNEAETLTDSLVGFYHFLEEDQQTLSLQSWSTRTKREFCKAQGKGLHYAVSEAGVWVDCIRQRRPVIHDDYASLPHRKGLPPGHPPVVRELVVPVFRGEKIVAILGVGNKPQAYARQDVEMVSLLADLAWTIVEGKRAEEALRESERRYRSIVEHAPFGITHSTNDGKLLSANPALASILKYDSAQELMETINRSSIQEELFPEPSERVPLVDKILNTESWTVSNNRLLCKDGSMVTCRVHSRRIMDEDGQARGFESYQENITDQVEAVQALRESEEKFRVLAETSPVAICIYQGERLVYANPAMERLFGYDAEELCRMKFWDWAHDDFKGLIRERGLARLAGEKVSGQYEAKYLTKAGKERYALVSAGVIEYQGRPTGVASFLDITERKRSEELIKSSLAEKEMLLREIHHRVKNNLQVVSSLLYLQSQKLTDPELQNHFLESQSRICSMALAHEQLYQSKSLAEVNIRSYLESLVGQLRQVFQRPGQQIECRTVVGDIVLDIAQVIPCGLLITELLSNAYKHAFADGRNGTITISIEQVGGRFVLSVADDGVGLPASLDYRQTTTLGLQLVTALVNQLNGTVDLQREGGTLFRVTFAESVKRDNQPDQQASDNLV